MPRARDFLVQRSVSTTTKQCLTRRWCLRPGGFIDEFYALRRPPWSSGRAPFSRNTNIALVDALRPCAVHMKYAESTRRRTSGMRISAERSTSALKVCAPQPKYEEKLTPRMRKSCSTALRVSELDHEHSNLRSSCGALQNQTRIDKTASPRVPAPTSICALLMENAWSRNDVKL